MGWQALFITNAEGLFSLAAPLPLPSGSLAAQTTQHKRICAASGKPCLPLKLLQAASTLGVASSCLPQRAQLASEGGGFTDKAARCRFVLPTLSPLPNGAAQTVDITKMTGKKKCLNLLEPQESLSYWLPTRFAREPNKFIILLDVALI
ncbi:MAG: hypothetical protein PHH38_03580 [Candidatus Cloacimonetes bacterium]|nr:hypothetical protein [Candidatus Cloacimonadota bacterium]